MDANGSLPLWDGMTFQQLAVHMSGLGARTYADQLRVASTDREWIDCSVLQALGCAFCVDILIMQEGMEPAILGASMKPNTVALDALMLAMVNDLHFWAVQPLVPELIVLDEAPSNGDPIRIPPALDPHAPHSGNDVEAKIMS